ncbi:MAG: hypothetical protein UV36_C0047G0002 [Parcubacteria group bacterium GW2011_GWC2_42_6]|nr:MAG: hypothetical protein UV36_C0047G0002 [Parcubacteria group bacterium GW2011_GWC2_42_6]
MTILFGDKDGLAFNSDLGIIQRAENGSKIFGHFFMPEDNKQDNKEKSFSALSLAWSLGWYIALPLVILALAGRWADKKFDTSPWFLLIGAMLAIGISSFLVFKKAMEIIKK